jgi:hypothetical protein
VHMSQLSNTVYLKELQGFLQQDSLLVNRSVTGYKPKQSLQTYSRERTQLERQHRFVTKSKQQCISMPAIFFPKT